jgi:phosphatidate cytidylyltransferase
VNGATALPVPETGFLSRALKTRVLSALVLAAPVLAAVYVGSPVFELVIAAAALAMAWEWYRMCASDAPVGSAIAVGVTILVAVAAVGLSQPALALSVLGVGAVLVLLISGRHVWLSMGVLYVGFPCVSLVWLRSDPVVGRETIFWLLALVWASDIGAYASGRLIGGPKLAPAVSPNKTWAGLIGAVVCAALVGTATAVLLELKEFWRLASVSAMFGAASQAGDLLESWIKRRFGIKDTGSWIPGHGGILDRVDALIAVAVMTALITAVAKGSMLTWL